MKIKLIGSPISTNSIYQFVCRGKFPNMYMSDKGVQLKTFYQQQARIQYQEEPLSDVIEVKVKLFFGDLRIRDIDNYNKILFDSLTGIIWNDDRQIQKLTIEKFVDKSQPRIELEVDKV